SPAWSSPSCSSMTCGLSSAKSGAEPGKGIATKRHRNHKVIFVFLVPLCGHFLPSYILHYISRGGFKCQPLSSSLMENDKASTYRRRCRCFGFCATRSV